MNAGVLEKELLNKIKPLCAQLPRKAVSTQFCEAAGRQTREEGKNKKDLAEQLRADINDFEKIKADRLVMIWVPSTETFIKQSAVHESWSL
jgi:hypothetical protein